MKTIKSVCDEYKKKLVKEQDFNAAAIVREMQRAVDPKGTKKLNPNQAKATSAFIRVLVKTTYQ